MAPTNPPENPVRSTAQSDTPPASDTISDTTEKITGVKALAQALGVARSTIYEWFKLPEHPAKRPDGAFDLAEWREFAQSIGSKTEAGESEDKDELQKEDLRLKNEQRRKKIEREDGLWTRNGQIEAELAPLVQEAKALLRAKFENELPSLYSPDPAVQAECKRLNKLAIDEVCARLSDPLPCQGRTDLE